MGVLRIFELFHRILIDFIKFEILMIFLMQKCLAIFGGF